MQADELYDIVEACTTPTTQIFSFRLQLLIDDTSLLLHNFVLYDLIEHGYIQAVSVIKTWVALEVGKRNSIHIPDENILEKYAKQHYNRLSQRLQSCIFFGDTGQKPDLWCSAASQVFDFGVNDPT